MIREEQKVGYSEEKSEETDGGPATNARNIKKNIVFPRTDLTRLNRTGPQEKHSFGWLTPSLSDPSDQFDSFCPFLALAIFVLSLLPRRLRPRGQSRGVSPSPSALGETSSLYRAPLVPRCGPNRVPSLPSSISCQETFDLPSSSFSRSSNALILFILLPLSSL